MRFARPTTLIFAAALAVFTPSAARADVKTQERTQVKFEGMLGKMMGMFGGKAMKEGLVSSIALKGDRQMSVSDETGQIIDLREEKVYNLDFKKKTYTVVTFEEMRRQLREAQEKARQQAKQSKPEAEKEQKGEEPKMEVEFDLKETGQKKSILGYDCREVVMTVTTHEKGKTLEQSGGMVMTTSMWLAPEIPALKEQMEFNRRYAQKVYGELITPETMQQMATAMAMYPGMKDAIERMKKESVNMSGTPLLTTMAFQAVANEQQAAEQKKQQESESQPSASSGGLGGMLARKMMKKKPESQEGTQGSAQAANRATIFTSNTEVLKISTDVAPADVAIPAGFSEKK